MLNEDTVAKVILILGVLFVLISLAAMQLYTGLGGITYVTN